MARFSYDQADNYGGQGGGGFFSLQNDKDVATVRIMYRNMDDVEGYAVHKVKVGDKERYVNCLREYNEPLSKCPFCEAKIAQQAKLFVPIYDVDSDTVKVWERGKKFFAKISSLCARYDNLVSRKFEIERNGKKGDTSTTYEIYPIGDSDGTTLEDLPELPQIIGGLVLDKSADEMYYYLDNERFPEDDNTGSHTRGSSRGDDSGVTRRTPARGDKF